MKYIQEDIYVLHCIDFTGQDIEGMGYTLPPMR